MLNERLGKIHFWLLFIGFHTTFLIQHWIGVEGMPRRYWSYLPEDGVTWMNQVSTIGAMILGISMLPFLYNVYITARRAPKVTSNDPWGYGRSLEWATSCPPPRHNFTSIPRIRSESPAFDLNHPEAEIHEPLPEPGCYVDGRWRSEVTMGATWKLFLILALFCFAACGGYIIWGILDHTFGNASDVGALGAGRSHRTGARRRLVSFITFYMWRLHRAQSGAELPEDRSDAEIDDGDAEQGFFSPWSWWPVIARRIRCPDVPRSRDRQLDLLHRCADCGHQRHRSDLRVPARLLRPLSCLAHPARS